MVKVNWNVLAANTGIQNDLIVGTSIYSGTTPTDPNWLLDLPWWVVENPDINTFYQFPLYTYITLGGGTYTLRARAWTSYDLTGATEQMRTTIDGKTIILYSGGNLSGVLDVMDRTATNTIISAEIGTMTFSFG